MALGGPALGIAFAIGTFIICQFVTKGTTFFMQIILLTCYSVFFVAEKMNIFVSGLLALVVMGFLFNVYLKNMM